LPIRIITATERFLVRLTEHADASEAAALEAFVSCYRGNRSTVRRLFDYDYQMTMWHRKAGPPTFFGQLYLSLLAASATEDTYGEGDFRRRLSLLLDLPSSDYVTHGLARLWEAVAAWSDSEGRAGRPIRTLVLPDPGHETIIGYSKRLAFPGFRDLSRLARVLSDHDLSPDSPRQAILSALGSGCSMFSSNFQGEYAQLRRVLQEDPDRAFMLPMWAAIEAASFDPGCRVATQRPRYVLELAFNEFGQPEIHVLTDMEPAPSLMRKLRICNARCPIDTCHLVIEPQTASAGKGALPDLFNGGMPLNMVLQTSAVRRQLEQGCLIFAPDHDASWLWRGSLPHAGPAHFVCMDRPKRLLMASLGELGQRDVAVVRVEGVPGWSVVGPVDCTPIAASASILERLSGYDAFSPGITSPRITLRGAVELPDGILLTTASRPRVLAIGCDRVSWGGSYEANHLTGLGSLERISEVDTFRPTLEQVRCLRLPAVITLNGENRGKLVATRQIVASATVPDTPIRLRLEETAYLEESAFGQLTGLGGAIESTTEFRSNPQASAAEAYLPKHPNFVDTTLPSEPPRGESRLSLWEDLCEGLYGTFVNSRSISDDRLADLTESLLFTCTALNPAILSAVLWHGLQVRKLWYRRWWGVRHFPELPSLLFFPGEYELHLVGLTSRILRQRFHAATGTAVQRTPGELGTWPPQNPRATGMDRTGAERVAGDLGLALDVPEPPSLPTLRGVLNRLSTRIRLEQTAIRTRFWCPRTRAFREKPDSTHPLILRRRDHERSASSFDLMDGDRVLWSTGSRAWALLIHRYLCKLPIFWIDGARVITDEPLPCCFALSASRSGGGLEIAEGPESALFVYRFGRKAQLDQFLQAWVPHPASRPLGLMRWAASASAGASVGQASGRAALLRRYARNSLS
jgi:hypothetical protein